MDNKTVFVRTSKGEDEVHSRTMHLPGDIKRALLMVDGSATYGEISKRAAPSLRLGLEAMLQELEKDGYVADKAKAGNIFKTPVPPKMSVPPRMSVPPKMSVPSKMATPHKTPPVDEGVGDLDFMSGFGTPPSNAPEAEAGKAAADAEKLKAEAIAKHEIEAAKLKAQQEAEAILHKAEQEAARIREEAEHEKQRAAAEIHQREEAARRAKEDAEAAKLKVEQAVKARLEAEAKALQQAEAARRKAEQDAAIAHETAERLAKQEREEAEKKLKKETEAKISEAPAAAKPDMFAFDAFRVDESQHLDKLHKVDQSAQQAGPAGVASAAKPDAFTFDAFHVGEPPPLAQPLKVDQPAQKVSSSGTASAAKADTFAFGAFHVDEPQPLAKPHADQSVQKANTAPHADKPENLSFDSFKIDIPQPPVETPIKETVSPAKQPVDTSRAVRHEETRQPVQREAPPSAASKTGGDTPSQEEIQRATQERIETEKRLEEEALAAKKHAETQAKAHAEAEQRKAEAARSEIEQAAKQAKFSVDAAPIAHVAKSTPVARVRRKPFTLGKLIGFIFKLGVFLLVLLLGVLFVAPYVLPTRDYMPKVEQLMSAKLHQPVHIGRLSGRILPTPRLELGEVYIGDLKQFQAEQMQINFAITGLIIETKPIDSVEFQGVKVSGAGLQNVSAWLQQLASDNQYPVARMEISRGMLDANVVQFTGVEGALDFNKIGEFTKGNLRSNDGKYQLDISAALGNKLQVSITLRNSTLPLLPNWPFDELTAKGMLSNNDLSISEFDGRILGGILQGNVNIDWHSGWLANGTIVAKTIPMQRFNNLLEGNVDGKARFKMSAVDLSGLADSATLEGSFLSKNGMISGMDIVETARLRSREHLPGGRTHFDELSGIVIYSNNSLHLKQIKVTTDVLNAIASLDFDKQQISGSMIAKLTLPEAMKQVELQIGGATDSPTLRFVP